MEILYNSTRLSIWRWCLKYQFDSRWCTHKAIKWCIWHVYETGQLPSLASICHNNWEVLIMIDWSTSPKADLYFEWDISNGDIIIFMSFTQNYMTLCFVGHEPGCGCSWWIIDTGDFMTLKYKIRFFKLWFLLSSIFKT